ncbi:hypothetical protein BVX98_06615 [bacterium F11]|nr:hypothetical protein BVX98_06615 [bacterium F11]
MVFFKLIKNRKGFSLTELMVAIAVLLFGILPLLRVIGNIKEGLVDHKKSVEAALLAKSLMDRILEKKWDEATPDIPSYIPLGTRIGVDGTEPFPSTNTLEDWDDVDDFNGHYEKAPRFYEHNVTVKYAIVPEDGSEITIKGNGTGVGLGNEPTNFKLITVTTSWKAKGFQQKHVLETVASNDE